MWVKANPNPCGKETPDCVLRAICIALNMDWFQVYDDLCALARSECNVPTADAVWGKYLYTLGFQPFLLPRSCPQCVTVDAFTRMYPVGTYIIGTGSHAVAIIDGNYYDSWDSGNEISSFFWKII